MSFIQRALELPQDQSFFLFGARNTGKSTLIEQFFRNERTLWIDLLEPEEEERYALNPSVLKQEVLSLSEGITHVVIDEIQKLPKLLDVVHTLIEKTDKKFILTGSNARKLKHGGANLLAGRAFVYNLYPFTVKEQGETFNLEHTLRWGSLPAIQSFSTEHAKTQFLQAYSQTYLKEEIWMEQFVRNLDPFRKFLEVSAQSNGKIINVANIARDVGVDDKTVKQYFSILEDTLIGFFLEPFVHSFRKRLSLKPKFYYFDTGVARALGRQLTIPLRPSTNAYGDVFEHFFILECTRLASYYHSEYRFSYLKTKDDAEIDLVVERPGKGPLFIEIKSSTNVRAEDLTTMIQLVNDFGECEAICASNDLRSKQIGPITVHPWRKALELYFEA